MFLFCSRRLLKKDCDLGFVLLHLLEAILELYSSRRDPYGNIWCCLLAFRRPYAIFYVYGHILIERFCGDNFFICLFANIPR